MFYQAIAILQGDQRKSIINRNENQMLIEVVIPYVTSRTIKAKWGEKSKSYQVIELRIYHTDSAYDKKSGVKLDDFIGKKKKNMYQKFENKAKELLGVGTFRVFVIMPIQGEKYGTQNDQRIYKEFDDRFKIIDGVLSKKDCVAIRIDKEHPMEDLVSSIKKEIERSTFVVADLTDERPSCYFEVGYAEALKKPIIYMASKESIITPAQKTKIHFDVHMNVNMFVNLSELGEKLESVIEKHKSRLFKENVDA